MVNRNVGSVRMVFSGAAEKTSGGLKKKDLLMNKWGRVVSKKRHNLALRRMKTDSSFLFHKDRLEERLPAGCEIAVMAPARRRAGRR